MKIKSIVCTRITPDLRNICGPIEKEQLKNLAGFMGGFLGKLIEEFYGEFLGVFLEKEF